MATIAENLQTIIDIKQDIKTAIENKGVTVGDSSFSEYSTKIDEITTGGGDTTTYSYKTPTADVEGLKALGWDDESIGYFRDNNLCYDWQKDNYIVTEGNKELYGVVTKDNISTYKSDPNFVYCPMIDTSNVTSMVNKFYYCSSLQSIPLLDTSNVTNMYRMFYNCLTLQSIPQFDTSNVTNMEHMFAYCSQLTTIPTLDTSNVTDMSNMFEDCDSLTTIPLLDCGNVTNMGTIFGYSAINTLTDLGGFKNLKISITSYFLDKAPKLTTESLMNVINNLYDLTTNGITGKTLKFGRTNLNKLTSEQIAVATAKGWTLT